MGVTGGGGGRWPDAVPFSTTVGKGVGARVGGGGGVAVVGARVAAGTVGDAAGAVAVLVTAGVPTGVLVGTGTAVGLAVGTVVTAGLAVTAGVVGGVGVATGE